jgi:hypothetical protein
MNIAIEPARNRHIYAIVPALRERERQLVSHLSDPAGALIAEMRRSQSWALLLDDAVVCVWGIQAASILANSAYVWLLTSRAVDEHPMLFLRQSKRMREAMLAEYATIEGVVAIDNPRSARWLRWLGAELGPSTIDGMLDFRLRRAA